MKAEVGSEASIFKDHSLCTSKVDQNVNLSKKHQNFCQINKIIPEIKKISSFLKDKIKTLI